MEMHCLKQEPLVTCGYLDLSLIQGRLNKIKNLGPQSHKQHSKSSIARCSQWLLFWIVQIENGFISKERSIEQCCHKELCSS